MHILHMVLVKGKSKEKAMEKVGKLLQNPRFAPWSDWSEVGGRWGNKYPGDIISQKDTPHLFRDAIEETLDSRRRVFDEATYAIDDYKYSDINLTSNRQFIPEIFHLKTVYDMYLDVYSPESYLYDAENRTTFVSKMEEDILQGATNWYAVAVDFHF